MLLHEYPKALDHQHKHLKAVHDLEEHQKMKKNMYKNLILAALIITIGFFASVLIIKIVLWLIGIGNAITGILLYNVSSLSKDSNIYTKIYDDHLEHCQGYTLSKKHTYITFYYDDSIESYQNNKGDLVIKLKDGYKTKIFLDNKKDKLEIQPKDNLLTLKFQDTESKLFLINNLYAKIIYPHKEYNIIEDEEDEDDLWDTLHKHGL